MPVISTGDYEPPPPNVCAGCGGKIADRYYLLAVDRQWHVHCLKCSECKLQLESELTCFAKDGNIYCKEDYYRMFAVKKCARCQRGIFATELVMRARDLVFHLHCFTCAWCNAALSQGDYFGLWNNLVYCRSHYELRVHEETLLSSEDAAHPPTGGSVGGGDERAFDPHPTPAFPSFSSVGSGRKGRPRKRKSPEIGMEGLTALDPNGCNLHLTSLDGNGTSQSSHSLSNGSQRTKRMRTSFKHHQLRTMKSYFAINQNPDAKDLKQLAQKTGLSKRVLQVWFQNARAKWRRGNLKLNIPMQPDSQLPLSPGATSSFSEPSPVPSCGMGGDGPIGSSSAASVSMPTMDFENSSPMASLVSSHLVGSGHGGDPLHLTSFHELF